MCGEGTACPAASACVAGRCQAESPTLRASVDAARRLVVRPVEMAFVEPGQGDPAPSPGAVALHAGAALLLRFEVPLPDEAQVVEAYLVLTRADADEDPGPVSLHATRIVEAWNARSTSYARAPRTEDLALPRTTVQAGGPRLVRLEIGDLVRAWRRRDPRDHGVAVVAEGGGARGTSFATSAVFREGQLGAAEAEPYLELYLR